MIDLWLLGTVCVIGPDGRQVDLLARQPKRAALLAYLALARPEGFHRRDKLLALFWPEMDALHGRNALSQALHVLRKCLGSDSILARGDEVSLAFDRVRCDVLDFEHALDAGANADAFALYSGDLLDGYFVSDAADFESWLDSERHRLRRRASAAAWVLAESEVAAGDATAAEGWVTRALALGAVDEHALRKLLRALDADGRRTVALRIADEFAVHLAAELQVEPSAETRALIEQIRRPGVSNAGPVTPQVQPAVTASPPQAAPAVRSRWFSRPVLVAGAALAIVGMSYFTAQRRVYGRPPPVRRIAILPLRNLGGDQNGYFADGVTEEIRTRLPSFARLSVVGGEQLLSYRRSGRTQQQIGALLGADYVLDGSASWLPTEAGRGKLRVLIQLTPTREGIAGWGNVFEEDIASMAELSALYTRLAQRVIDGLDLALESPGKPVGSPGTTNLEAYDDYLRGREFMRRTVTAINHLAAIQSFERAVRRDSTFALAYAHLGNAHANAYWVGGLPFEHMDSAKRALDRAARLDPNLTDTHISFGQYYNSCCEDYDRALYHLNRAMASRPDDARLLNTLGILQKRKGAMTEAIATFQRAVPLDPLWSWPIDNIGHTQLWMRRYGDAELTFRRSLSMQPQNPFAYVHLALVLLLRDGNVVAARQVLDEGRRDAEGLAEVRLPFDLAMMSRDYQRALAELHPPEPALTRSLLDEWLVSDRIRGGLAHWFSGDKAAARRSFDSARVELERELSRHPVPRRTLLWLRSGLAIAMAGLADTAQAKGHVAFIEAGEPLKIDAIEGSKYLLHAAVACILLDDRDGALRILKRVLAGPGLVSEQSLKLEPYWDALRGERRFRQLHARTL